MAPHHSDSSDSEDEDFSGVETSVLLGVPDGEVEAIADVTDAAVSRIGGHPAFLPSREPPLSSSQCKICSHPCELLVQMWCPFEDSPMDRALYVWGCAKSSCQGKQGSVRAWRGLRRNDAYATKLEKKLARKRAAEEAKALAATLEMEKKNAPKVNPFAMKTTSLPNTFGIGTQLFGDASAQPPPTLGSPSPHQDEGNGADVAETDSSVSDDELLTAMASATLDESPWTSAPSYPPIYLSTVSEYLPPPPKPKLPPGVKVTDPFADDEKNKDKDISWAAEAYEDSLELDHVFESFMKRVGYENEQCVRQVSFGLTSLHFFPFKPNNGRYELNGTPLPYSSDKVFDSLFPSPPATTLTVTKAAFTVNQTPKRSYFPSPLPPCPSCKSKRVFECQLMPNLINVLRRPGDNSTTDKITDEERHKALERALKSSTGSGANGESDAGRGMEWGTCMVFSCEKDCCVDDGRAATRECWREEVVLIQVAI